MKISRLLIPIGLGVGLSIFFLISVRSQIGMASEIVDSVALPKRQSGATIRYVAKSGIDQGECTVSADPCLTVQYAIDQAKAGDEVRIAAGVYTDINAYSGLAQIAYISKTIDLRGGYTLTNWITPDYSNHLTVLDAQSLGRETYITGSITTTLEGLRLTGGDSGGLGPWVPGGGVYVVNATVTISACEIISNTSPDGGGGLFLAQSRAHLNQNTFRANVASFGGGIHSDSSVVWMNNNTLIDNVANDNAGGGAGFKYSQATLRNNIIRGNHSTWAGGGLAFDEGGKAILISNTIEANTAVDFGGGIILTSISDVELLTNTIMGNSGYFGGGIYTNRSNAALRGNTIRENVADSNGGGVYQEFGELEITENIIVSNTTDVYYGGGIYAAYGTILLRENLLRDNTAQQGGGFYLYYHDAAVMHNAITDNTAHHMGGGAYLLDTPAMLEGNVISGNATTGFWGGGIVVDGSNVTMSNNLIIDNQSANLGSGLIFDRVEEARLSHNTFTHNEGGIGDAMFLASGSHLTLTNTILVSQTLGIYVSSDDSSAHLEGTLWGSGAWANGTDWAGDGEIVTGTVNIWRNPGFVNPDSGDYHLGYSSAAIDAGVDSGTLTDIDGEARPRGAGYDIGADEFTGTRTRLFFPILLH